MLTVLFHNEARFKQILRQNSKNFQVQIRILYGRREEHS